MSAGLAAALLCWLSGCGSALWRYSTHSPDYRIFSTRSAIIIQYEGTAFSEWSVPATCTIQNKSSPTTELRCFIPGTQVIKPIVTGPEEEEARYLLVEHSHICFLWYYTVTNNLENLTQTLTIWVYDPEHSNADELQWSADTPSEKSIVLTKVLSALGQQPTIHTLLKRRVYSPADIQNEGTWTVEIPMTSDDVLKEIKGNRVDFQDCFIANLPFLLMAPLRTIPEDPGFLPLTSPAGTPLMTVWSTCRFSLVVVVASMETFQTNDSFHTWTRVRVPPGVLSDVERHSVTDVILLTQEIVFLIKGSLYLRTLQEFTRLQSNEGLPRDGIRGIETRTWCASMYVFKVSGRFCHSVILAWTEHEIYLGYSSFKFVKLITTAELKSILGLPSHDTLTIQHLGYTLHPAEFAVLVQHCVSCTAGTKVYLMTYNEHSARWASQDFALEIPVDTVLRSRFLYSAMPDLVMWDRNKVYYCYQNFTVTGIMQATTGEEDLSLLAGGSNIYDVFVDYFGNIIVLMENNVMFYSKINVRDAIKLHAWTSEGVESSFALSASSKVYLVTVSEDGTVRPQEYPLKLEVQSVTSRTEDQCPYMAFHNNIFQLFYFLDKGEGFTVWSQIIYPENAGVDIVVESYGPKILKMQKVTHYEIAQGYCTKTITITFSQDTNYESIQDYFKVQEKNSGLVLVQLRASEYSKTCPVAQKVFQIAVGCDSHKYIAVGGFSKTECQHRDFSYIIDKSYLRQQPPKDLKVRYDWGKFGCPLRLDFREKFQPLIQLFDENGYVKDVDVNFIVWEVHGRDDYSFNTTMLQSGCLNEAQTWELMVARNPHLPLEEVWGPENYRPCFSYAIGTPGDLNQPYEIINISNYNHLYWPNDHTGMYVFRVKILDPNYSFCNLSAIFAVETYGVIPRPNIYLVVSLLFVLVLVFLSILVFSYFYYLGIYRQFIYEPLHKPVGKQKKS
ncbi:cation channel sperm-associated auxiliary subunit epsilon [Perognathus longimembris pacificus]|uniref:cation channel sperm-associated auxiliary subunit epsilon n=1 Tax=Perognathus longimembris pacificus TaxID=214514 RepID=UPI002018D390|nr:cation channel sperm-associated auxiliary subunit epsilon [Perognathus longimembris pacificus]